MYIYGIQSDRMHSFHPKHSNLENSCFRYIRPQKAPKIAQKTDHSIAIYSIFLIGMVRPRAHADKTGRAGTPPSLAWKPLDWTGRPRFKMYGHETARRRCQLLFVIFPCKLQAPKILKGNFSQSCFFPFLM